MDMEHRLMKCLRSECPDVKGIHNFAFLEPYDYLNMFSAPHTMTAFRVAALVMTLGDGHTEVWPATEL